MLKNKLYLIFLLFINFANAEEFDRCFMVASVKYKIPVELLKAIAKTETGMNPIAMNINSNRSYDIGIMQINSYWFKKLEKVGIKKDDLLDGCKNIQVGAWILAQNIKQYGFNAKAIGANR